MGRLTVAALKDDIEQRFQQVKMGYDIVEKPSSNHSNEDLTPQFIIIHCIGFDENSALKILTKSVSEGGGGVSSHFLIPQVIKENPYPIYQLVHDNKKARHAGASSWGKVTSFNNCSIGIEFHSPNYAKALQHQAGKSDLDWFYFEEFTEAQIDAGIQLIHYLMKKYNIKPENVLGHSDIAPYREDSKNGNTILGKTDPGLTFPWEKLAKTGIGVWPKSTRTRSNELDISLKNAQLLLATYGYPVPITGILDPKTQHSIKAFQMHFMPKHCDGKITAEMIICLENLIDHQYEHYNKPPPPALTHGYSAIAALELVRNNEATTLDKLLKEADEVLYKVRNGFTL